IFGFLRAYITASDRFCIPTVLVAAQRLTLKQEFITPHCPQQNEMVERVIRTLKEQCVHRHRFESQTHALRVIADWIAFYNQQRPHQALKMMTPDAAYAATLTP
ncbi:MAG: integrase core domain-containing protein, partial [Burkholderia sp.]